MWVLNGSGQTGQAADIAAFLEYQGISASAPTQKPPKNTGGTKIVVYGEAKDDAAATIAYLADTVRRQGHVLERPERPREHRGHDGRLDPRPDTATGAIAPARRLAAAGRAPHVVTG